MLSLILLLIYPASIKRIRVGGPWRWLALPAGILDVLANYTELALLTWDFPKRGEYTFSMRLRRIQYGNRWQRWLASLIIPYLNYFDAGHVKP